MPRQRLVGAKSPTPRFRTICGRLSDLKDVEIASYEIDLRGWGLIGRDGEKIGKIHSLLVSPSARKAYFAVVDTGGSGSARPADTRAPPGPDVDERSIRPRARIWIAASGLRVARGCSP